MLLNLFQTREKITSIGISSSSNELFSMHGIILPILVNHYHQRSTAYKGTHNHLRPLPLPLIRSQVLYSLLMVYRIIVYHVHNKSTLLWIIHEQTTLYAVDLTSSHAELASQSVHTQNPPPMALLPTTYNLSVEKRPLCQDRNTQKS